MNESMKIRIGILTVSDRAHAGQYEDLSGPEIEAFFSEALSGDWEPVKVLVPDEQDQIQAQLAQLVDREHCCLVVTTGGTGPAPRDVTPEATEAICDRLMPGFGELMRSVSLQHVPTAILSRQTAGLCDKSLIVNLPGKPSAIRDCLEAVFPAIPYCVYLAGGPEFSCSDSSIRTN